MDQILKEYLEEQGYKHVQEKSLVGICAVLEMNFTWALVYGLTDEFYVGRFCFPKEADAVASLNEWMGKGLPPGPWIKHKGKVEFRNPNLV